MVENCSYIFTLKDHFHSDNKIRSCFVILPCMSLNERM